MLEGSFSLSTVPNEVIFYLEGPPPGTQLLIKSVVILRSSSTASDVSPVLCPYSILFSSLRGIDYVSIYFD